MLFRCFCPRSSFSSYLPCYPPPPVLHHPSSLPACPHPPTPLFFFFLLHPTHPAICFPKPPLSSVDFVTYREDNSISCSIGSANGRSEISCGIKLPPECFFIFFLNWFPSVFSSPLVSPFGWLPLPYLSRLARFTLALTLSRSPSPNFSQGLVCSM